MLPEFHPRTRRIRVSAADRQRSLVSAMLEPAFYPQRPREVSHVETHISHLFFAGDLVYKIKKAVQYSFVDYSTRAKRKYFLQEELRLNRRLAPSVYLGILPISHDDHGWQLGSDAHPAEHVLVMRRLPARRMLDYLLEQGQVTVPMVQSLAELLAQFHAEAEGNEKIRERGRPEVVRKVLEQNLEDLRPFIGRGLSEEIFAAEQFFNRSLSLHRDLMDRRVAEGRIRELHGDLHCEHVCFAPEGIQIFDCIEFNPDLRRCDIASEIAFLLMDLECRGAGELGRAFLERYVELSGDHELPELLSFYQCYRALVRGKVYALQSAEMSDVAGRYFDLAYSYTWDEFKPFLILVCGLTGSGKSTLARALGRRLGLPVISSDVTRKTLAGASVAPQLASYGEGIYSPAMTQRTYASLVEQAEPHILDGRGAILDATFRRQAHRAAIVNLAARTHVPLVVIHCRLSEGLVQERLVNRSEAGNDISDGRWEIYAAQKESFEPIRSIPPAESYLILDTELPPAEVVSGAETFLRAALKRRS
jgi:aminoglycoside phosphotransferase family enzyme/predicted kinase